MGAFGQPILTTGTGKEPSGKLLSKRAQREGSGGRGVFWYPIRCSCVNCGFTENLSFSIVSDMIRTTRGCPIHGDGSWPSDSDFGRWKEPDWFDYLTAFLIQTPPSGPFIWEFVNQFENQMVLLSSPAESALFELYVFMDQLVGRTVHRKTVDYRTLREAVKRALVGVELGLESRAYSDQVTPTAP